jgi:hypothetical protein
MNIEESVEQKIMSATEIDQEGGKLTEVVMGWMLYDQQGNRSSSSHNIISLSIDIINFQIGVSNNLA